MHACTIIARNYLPYARVLAETFGEHHPNARFTTLILDGADDLAEPFEILSPYEIGIEPDELHRMAMIYDLKELATAVKPWLLRTLLDRGAGAAVYFDPDIAIYRPLDDIGKLAQEHSIVLTPHTTEPLPDDGCLPDYSMIMYAGIYNLGFIGVSERAIPFLDWWSDRLSRRCLVALDQALFVDQRWVDFVPSLFDHYILRDPGCNVAYWNLHKREVRRKDDHFEVNGEPLRFFHFSGYKPDTPSVLSHHAGTRPRILLSQNPDLARLCEEYGRRVLAHGYGRREKAAYEYDLLPGGIAVDARMRRLFREELLEAERTGRGLPPDPFDPDVTANFLEWLREPVGKGWKGDVSRYAYALYSERADLQRAFPRVLGADVPRYLEWLHRHGQPQVGFARELLPGGPRRVSRLSALRGAVARAVMRIERCLRALSHSHSILARGKPAWRALRRARVIPGRRTSGFAATEAVDSVIEVAAQPAKGVNLVGYLNAELGIGEVARKLMKGLDRAGIEFSTITYDRTLSRQEHQVDERRPQQAPFDMNVICVNADQLPIFREDVGLDFFKQRYSVGVWFWEVSSFPFVFHDAFKLVDEVWAATSFVRDTLAQVTSKPVRIVPLPLEVPTAEPVPRERFELPDGFMFLFSFDFLSIFERKNPLGLLDAFSRAFADGEGPILVLKSINGEHDFESLERLRLAAAERSDVFVLDGYLAPELKDALMASCDCYVSLHRSEGFGLTMAEAMAYGKPVVATNYSGNVDFMHAGNSYLIPYELVPIPKGCDPYPARAEWADPDLNAAAAAMRRVFEDPEVARELGERARDDILDRFSVDRTAAFLAERCESRTFGEKADVSARTADEALAEVERRLAQGPTRELVRAKRRRPGVRAARAVLRRLLWPYLQSQHELEVAIVRAIGQIRRETLTELRDAINRVESSLGHVESSLGQLGTDVSKSVNELRADVSKSVNELRADVSKSVNELRADVSKSVNELRSIEAELTREPYMSDPESLRIIDDAGRSAIGFRDSSPGAGSTYQAFEDTFRGPEEFIRERQRPYLDLIGERSPVLDIGCGRGEFLELMVEVDIEARGIDTDPGMIARCRDKGLAVEQSDAISYLECQSDGSLGVVFSAQVIEHLPYEELVNLFQLAERKLAPGGLFIAETVNPHSIQAFKAFWVDLTHRAPIFPEVAITLARLQGFESAYVFFPLGSGEWETDRRTQGEYAVVARRAT
jgi:glycosyltransferase involved in cell wall biosynthesis/2-polyprenyl-3-methyl-5-hydroxy-6-metoxy-1,4-benzoquinol methylase